MINTNAFDYINVLDKAADAAALRHQVLSNNIANDDTPGFKRQDVAFESELKKALGKATPSANIDKRVSKITTDSLKPEIYTDMSDFSYRLDKNNVDPEAENVMLAENQIKYKGLLDSITQEFNNLQIVMK